MIFLLNHPPRFRSLTGHGRESPCIRFMVYKYKNCTDCLCMFVPLNLNSRKRNGDGGDESENLA